MSDEKKPIISALGVNVDEWRKSNGIPPLNHIETKVISSAYFPKYDPAALQAYAKKHNLKF
jgi:hypothetical protein